MGLVTNPVIEIIQLVQITLVEQGITSGSSNMTKEIVCSKTSRGLDTNFLAISMMGNILTNHDLLLAALW